MHFLKARLLRREKGYTLTELLVVMSIIGLLAAITVIGVAESRKKSRDADRVADIKQIQLALELYYDQNHSYPNSTSEVDTATGLMVLVTGGFTSKIPNDPLSTQNYVYKSNAASNSTSYCLGARLEGPSQGASTCSTPTLSAPYTYSVGSQIL